MAASEHRSRIHVNHLPEDDTEELRTVLSMLRERFGNRLTLNPDVIPSGADVKITRQRVVDESAVLIAVITPNWLTVIAADRLQNPRESTVWVRSLLAMALADDRIVIPVLMGVAPLAPDDLPDDLRPLAQRQAVELTTHNRAADVGELIRAIESAPERANELEHRELETRLRAREVESALARARSALEAHELDGAIASVQKALALQPDHDELIVLRRRIEDSLSAERASSQASRETNTPQRETKVDENVQFTVYRRSAVQPGRWYPLLVFAHLTEKRPDTPPEEGDPVLEMQAQARQILGESADQFQPVTSDSRGPVMREGELRVVPQVEGVQFNPPERRFIWSESVHREEFRMRAAERLHGRTARGMVTIYSGNLLLADVPLSIRVDKDSRKAETEESAARPYRRIFASYSHGDASVVEEFEAHARATGDQYLRDVVTLRAGEVWNDRLLDMIKTADVFQLFWSWNAMGSELVKAEWKFALTLSRPHFVRPVYWEEPLPERSGMPPPSLRQLHFQRVYPRLAVAAAVPGWTRARVDNLALPAPSPIPAEVTVPARPTGCHGKREPRDRVVPGRRRPLTAALRVAAISAPLLAVALYIASTYQPPQQSLPVPSPPGQITQPTPPVAVPSGSVPSPPVSVTPTPVPPTPVPSPPSRGIPSEQPRFAGLSGVSIDEISLRGLVKSGDSYFAVVEGPGQKTYTLHAGDRLVDGVARAVTPEGVAFIQDVSDPLALQKQREVFKTFRPPAK